MSLAFNCFLVFIGAGIGGVLRFLTISLTHVFTSNSYPIGTKIVNLLGCFLMGFLFMIIMHKYHDHRYLQPLLLMGLLGGYTTFSSFSLDIIKLLTSGKIVEAIIYLGISVIGGLLCTMLGIFLANKIILK